jgi:hypothetical protein
MKFVVQRRKLVLPGNILSYGLILKFTEPQGLIHVRRRKKKKKKKPMCV